jgi:transcriptional regulator with XRE-family HTH domain
VSARVTEELSASVPLAERIQSILASRGLTLYRVSQQSAALYGQSSPYFLPHNLYSDLRVGSFRPSIHQIVALSNISGYRLADWLRVFGFNLEDITRLQILLPSKRTILLDTLLTDPDDWVRWPQNRFSSVPVPPMVPLAKMLKLTNSQRISSLSKVNQQGFLYAKVGTEDAFAFPDLAPGSIVRVDPRVGDRLVFSENSDTSNRLFLIEHSKGFCCCSIRPLADGVIVPVGALLPYARVELRIPVEARILGAVDLEIRLLLKTEQPKMPKDLARRWKAQPVAAEASLGELLQRVRTKMNLSLREAATISQRIGGILNDPQYCISASSLCDYELSNKTPRDVHKIVTLCSMFGLRFETFLNAIGVAHKNTDAQGIPDLLLPRLARANSGEGTVDNETDTGFFEQLLEEVQEVPLFLRNSIDWLSTSANTSLDDFFWIGGERDPLHPYLANGLIALVNRRRKTAFHFASKPVWQQPIYIILKRDGTYLAACCGAENGTLVIHPYSRDFHRPLSFRNHQDAEIVGQIVAVARKLG